MPRIPATDPGVAVAYLRVSTDEQHLGPEAQREAIERWAGSRGVTVVAWHQDTDVSGGDALADCPALLAAIDDLATHRAGLLVVAKRDRLARDVYKAAMLAHETGKRGTKIASAAGEGEGDDPSAQLMRQIVDAFAEYERALIRSRTKAALQVKKRRGERTGSVLWGCSLDPTAVDAKGRLYKLVPNPGEIAIRDLALELRRGGATLQAIADELSRRGHVPRSGGRWYPAQVLRMVA